jgi:23S rRNA pseudouridine1911/1915/1917 synthase
LSTLTLDSSLLQLFVEPAQAGARLDAFLANHIEGWSRARLQQLIEDGEVLVNGHAVKSSYKLRANDQIEVELTPSPVAGFAAEDIPIEVVFEDADLIVVNKPAGMVVHPAAGVPSGTLANALAFHFQQLSQFGGAARPGIVHRLDRGTSGLLVIAKTEAAHEDLSNQFRAREVFKSYVALVHGQMEKRNGQIDQPIARDPRNRTRMAVVRGGRAALSFFRIRESYDRFTLLDVELKTGRTHQIRVHLAAIDLPVAGDPVYGRPRELGLERQFLHAARLVFEHPFTGETVNVDSPLPQDLAAALESARE